MDYQHLSTLLWREQELLDLLLFKAEEKQYLILTGKTRWLARIAHEIEVVLDQLRTLEVERAAATEAIAVTLGLGANPSLRQVAEAAPAPWNDLFAKHHEALLVLVTDLRSLSDANRELIEGGLAAIGDALLSVKTPSAGTYGSTGRTRRRHPPRRHPGRGPVSTFSGLNAATTALWAQRRALDVTGQNIANVNTEGYSRQRVDLQAIGGSVVPAFYSTSPGIGAGVSADDVTRIRDAFLEGRGHTEHANSARLTAETDAYELVEQAFREPGDTGIQSLLSDMWNGWQDVANNPKDAGGPRAGAAAAWRPWSAASTSARPRSARSGTRPARTSRCWSTTSTPAPRRSRELNKAIQRRRRRAACRPTTSPTSATCWS